MRELFRYLKRPFGLIATLPVLFRKPGISMPENVGFGSSIDFLSEKYNSPGMSILELGSRNVTGANFRSQFSKARYVGFDFYAGENVDVVGDAHKMSSYFDQGEQFDLIFSSAVFEHLHMPWVAAQEIHKLLKVGGAVFVETHFSWRSHERPWNFFQFSDMGLRALFNKALGFEVIECGMSNPMVGYYTRKSHPALKFKAVRG